MRFSKGLLELIKELTSQAGQLPLDDVEVTGRVAQAYAGRLRSLLDLVGQEANEAELRGAASDLLALFAGNHDKELLQRRIDLGRKLGAARSVAGAAGNSLWVLFRALLRRTSPGYPIPGERIAKIEVRRDIVAS